MKKTLTFAIISSSLVYMTSCDNSNASHTNTSTTDSIIYPSVETNKANSEYKPAFEGQTRINGVKTNTAFEFKVLTESLKSPWGIAVLPDGRLLITEKEGVLKIADEKGLLSESITGLPKVDADGQGGLLGITLDPNFSTNRLVYWTFSEPANGGNHTAVAKGTLSTDEKKIENAQVIYQSKPTYNGKLHYGGRIIFDKEGYLLVSIGERSDLETRPLAQDLKSSLGKIIRITTDGKAAPNNPFSKDANALPEIYTYGHRNPQSLAFHPETGDLWEAEFGPRGGDELNIIASGKNYGWPVITYGVEYSGKEIGQPPIQQKEGMEQPVYYWDPVISPSGMTFYTGNAIPEWKNNLFIGGLSSTHIVRIVIKDNKVVGEERLLQKEGQRFRDVVQGKNEDLFAVTDAGRLYRIYKK